MSPSRHQFITSALDTDLYKNILMHNAEHLNIARLSHFDMDLSYIIDILIGFFFV